MEVATRLSLRAALSTTAPILERDENTDINKAVAAMLYNFDKSAFTECWVNPWSEQLERDNWLRALEYGETILKLGTCPFCDGQIKAFYMYNRIEPDANFDAENHHNVLIACPVCTWYARSDCYVEVNTAPQNYIEYSSFQRKIVDSDTPIERLEEHLARMWDSHRQISPAQAEDLVANIFSEHLNCHVHYVTNGVYSPDGGIDFVLVEGEAGLETAFQVKRRLTSKPEGVKPVREFLGSLLLNGYSNGCYVTFSPRFTRSILSEISKAEQDLEKLGMHVDLVDGKRLRDILRNHRNAHKRNHPLIDSEVSGSIGWHEIPLESATIVTHDAPLHFEGKGTMLGEILDQLW